MSETRNKNLAAGRENKPHIGIFGRCNSGKSTLLNHITGADAAVVSPQAGTTTDLVRKGYEITGLGPVVFIDTPGFDDISEIGGRRVERTEQALNQVDLALLVFREWGAAESEFAQRLSGRSVPWIAVENLSGSGEIAASRRTAEVAAEDFPPSAVRNDCGDSRPGKPAAVIQVNPLESGDRFRESLFGAIGRSLPPDAFRAPSMFEGRVLAGQTVLLVCPVDSEAPAGRLILPQVQAIRELLDRHAVPVVVQPREIPVILEGGLRPALAVTDSQVFPEVRAALPDSIELTSFSILLAAAKGDYRLYQRGLEAVEGLKDGDKVLIAENCSHHSTCDDIGRVKIPRWLKEYTGADLGFTVVAGLSPLPDNLGDYALMVQCGGCMVTRSQLRNRIRQAASAGVPVTNYGMLIRKIRN